jgi:hypothetical protein
MRGHEAAYEHEGFRRLAWVLLGASAFTVFVLFMLAWPSPAHAQTGPVCPQHVPAGPASPDGKCRPLCETPSSLLRALGIGVGIGTFTATAQNPYDPGDYQTRGDPECAVPAGPTNQWNVKKFCSTTPDVAHCVHWHVLVPGGVPVPATALVTATASAMPVASFFTGWTAASNCVPSQKKAVSRNVCSIVMDADKDVTAMFADSLGRDLTAPDPVPALSVQKLNVNTVRLTWIASDDETWLGGYEILRNGELYTPHPRASAATTSVTLGNQLCKSTYTWQVRAFDSESLVPSDIVSVFMGNTCPKLPPPNTVSHGVAPPHKTRSRTAYFHWGANRPNVRYQCKLDEKKWKKCFPGKTYRRLQPGKHVFRARAYDASGHDKTPLTYRWTILK